MKFYKRFFISSILLFSFALQADETLVWSVYKDNIRYFLDIEQEGSFFKLNHYRQYKGEYQEKISVKTFATHDDAHRYINLNHPNYTQSEKLAPWRNQWSTINDSKNFSDKRNNGLTITQLDIEGRTLNLSEIRNLFTRGLTSSNPLETPARRWDLQSFFLTGSL